jgi:hypothetical protein
MEMAVCIHFIRTWKVRPKGSGQQTRGNSASISILLWGHDLILKELDLGRTIAGAPGSRAAILGQRDRLRIKSDQSPVTVANREGER